ncbi:MAG: MotA/TolQ/ExbB proton channel family protein [Verrucomicrobia bacterium]|nr:MotA/TolQ/ExbB proton channel family protein [Verrucomicrobiota bacterium]MCH8525764.1 MotA/TolQ/ExbB proton channel family protein [Kiritimatiellia bacterium]
MNAAREAVQAYWIAGGPLLALLAVIAFGIWAYYFRTQHSLRSLHLHAAGQALPDPEAERWQTLARRDLGILAAFTAAAPLVGLLGTVLGMVETFDAVSEIAGEPGRRMAGGIRQALVTTQFGLLIAIPGVFGLARLQRLARDVDVALITARHEARLP